MPQQPQRRHVRPVQVIEHDEQARAGCRVREELANRFEHLEPPLRRRMGLDRRAPQFGRDNSQVGPLFGSWVMDRGDVTDDLPKQPIRRAALILTSPGPHAPPPRRGRAGRRFLGEAGLADSGLTADECDPALATAGRVHLRGEHRQFRRPPDEHRACSHASNGIPGTTAQLTKRAAAPISEPAPRCCSRLTRAGRPRPASGPRARHGCAAGVDRPDPV